MIIETRLTFEAAHRNTGPQSNERTRRLHGHSYEVTVAVAGPVDPAVGWVQDFADVKESAGTVIDRLDHFTLNDVAGMTSSTREDVERWLSTQLRIAVPGFAYCRVGILGANDWSPRISRIEHAGERLAFGFAAAHFLPNLPDTHKCRRVHGHSFRIELTGKDLIKTVAQLARVYEQLDHRLLNEVSGLENPTSEHLAQWIGNKFNGSGVSYDEIMVSETCTSCCRLTR